MPSLKFYHLRVSGPCISVHLVLKALGVDFEKIHISTRDKEQFAPDFLKLNPIHTVPTIDDGGFSIFESGAIIHYLAEKYGQDSPLYPKDDKKRFEIHKFLFFNGTLLSLMGAWLYPPIVKPGTKFDPNGGEKFKEYIQTLNDKFLAEREFLVGDLSVADLAIIGTLGFMRVIGYDFEGLPNIHKWAQKINKLPYYEECTKEFDAFVKGMDRSIYD